MDKRFKALSIIGAMGFCGAANAAWVDVTYGAHVELSATVYEPYAEYESTFTDQSHAVGQLVVSLASQTYSAGDADFGSGNVALSAVTANQAGEAAYSRVFIHDTLTFQIAGGGSADVLAQISGNAEITGTFPGNTAFATYTLNLGGGSLIFSDSVGPYGNSNFGSFTGGTLLGGGWAGQYTAGGQWHVVDGQAYSMVALVIATTGGNAAGSAYINDPLTFTLPAGVTVTSASGSNYASSVPLPGTLWLLGSGVFGVFGYSRRSRARVRTLLRG